MSLFPRLLEQTQQNRLAYFRNVSNCTLCKICEELINLKEHSYDPSNMYAFQYLNIAFKQLKAFTRDSDFYMLYIATVMNEFAKYFHGKEESVLKGLVTRLNNASLNGAFPVELLEQLQLVLYKKVINLVNANANDDECYEMMDYADFISDNMVLWSANIPFEQGEMYKKSFPDSDFLYELCEVIKKFLYDQSRGLLFQGTGETTEENVEFQSEDNNMVTEIPINTNHNCNFDKTNVHQDELSIDDQSEETNKENFNQRFSFSRKLNNPGKPTNPAFNPSTTASKPTTGCLIESNLNNMQTETAGPAFDDDFATITTITTTKNTQEYTSTAVQTIDISRDDNDNSRKSVEKEVSKKKLRHIRSHQSLLNASLKTSDEDEDDEKDFMETPGKKDYKKALLHHSSPVKTNPTTSTTNTATTATNNTNNTVPGPHSSKNRYLLRKSVGNESDEVESFNNKSRETKKKSPVKSLSNVMKDYEAFQAEMNGNKPTTSHGKTDTSKGPREPTRDTDEVRRRKSTKKEPKRSELISSIENSSEDDDAAMAKKTDIKQEKKVKQEIKQERKVNGKRIWTSEETVYLVVGVKLYGKGSWQRIFTEFRSKFQAGRNTVDLKDKYRNLDKPGSELKLYEKQAEVIIAGLRAKKQAEKQEKQEKDEDLSDCE